MPTTLGELSNENFGARVVELLHFSSLALYLEFSRVNRSNILGSNMVLAAFGHYVLRPLDPSGHLVVFPSSETGSVRTLVLRYHRPAKNDISRSALSRIVSPQIGGCVGNDADVLGTVFLRLSDSLESHGRLFPTVSHVVDFHRNW